MKPRMPNSPPATPTMTLSLTTSGAIVDGVAVLVVLQRGVPHDGAGLHVEREQVRVERRHEQLVAEHRRSRG